MTVPAIWFYYAYEKIPVLIISFPILSYLFCLDMLLCVVVKCMEILDADNI